MKYQTEKLQPGVTYWLVQATLAGKEYTHYICKEKKNADRLLGVLSAKRPSIAPFRVTDWTPSADINNRSCIFADNSDGPK